MGDRISIQFVKGSSKSAVLFSHWMGKRLLKHVEQFMLDLEAHVATKDGHNTSNPLDRLEPETVMINFIGWLFRENSKQWFEGNVYLPYADYGDDSNNGRWTYDLNKKEWTDA